MAGIITGIIGGIQGASAAHNAANKQIAGYKQAGQTVMNTAGQVNQEIKDTTHNAILPVLQAGQDAASGATDAYKAAQTGVRQSALDANGMLAPYAAAGTDATGKLQTLADTEAKGFTASDMTKYDPGYQFRLDQGSRAIQAKAQAMGVSSGTLKALANYNQNTASSEYGAAFDRWNALNKGQADVLGGLATRGETASTQSGKNLMEGEEYAGDIGLRGEEYAGNMRTNTQQYGSNATINAETIAANNSMNAGKYLADTQAGIGTAGAQGDMGASKAWNGMLTSIGSGVDDIIAGGMGDPSGGFNWRTAFGGAASPAGGKVPVAPNFNPKRPRIWRIKEGNYYDADSQAGGTIAMGGWTPPPVMRLDQPDPPVYHSPLDSRAKLMNLQNLALQQQEGQQNLQVGQLNIADRQRALARQQATDAAFKNAYTVDENGRPHLDEGRLTKELSLAGFGSAATPILEAHTKYQKSLTDLQDAQGKVAALEQDAAGHLAAGVQAGNNDAHLFVTHVKQAVDSGAITPAHAKALTDPVTAALLQDPTGEQARALVKNITDQMIAGSPKERELATQRITADATAVRDKAQAGAADTTSLKGRLEIAGQTAPIPVDPQAPIDPAAWTAWREKQQDDVKAYIPPTPSPAGVALVKNLGLTMDQRRQADQAKATLDQTANQTDLADLEINGKPHKVLVNKRTGQVVQDLGESGIKPPQVNVNASAGLLDRESARFAKPHEKAVTDANAQLEKINDARAMINGSAEAQALGIPKVLTALVSGAGSGVRITQPELNAIAKARGITGDVEGYFNQLSGKGKLTAEQKTQLTQLMDDVADRIRQKQAIANDALDKINSAGSREDIVRIDSEARRKLGESVKPAQAGGAAPLPASLSQSDVGKVYLSPKTGKRMKITAVNPQNPKQFQSQEVP